jgi:hypothetical protein
MRMPKHLISEAVIEQLERGENEVSDTNVDWARSVTGFEGAWSLRTRASHQQERDRDD